MSLDKALQCLKGGRPIIICDDADREAEGDLAFAANQSSPTLVNFALTMARGLLCISMKEHVARRLGVSRLSSNGVDRWDTPFGMPITYANGESGISAASRSITIKMSCSESAMAHDFCMPGHVATLIAKSGGLRERDGHTEAILDLLAAAKTSGNGVLCEILTPSGEIAKRDYLEDFACMYGLPILEIAEVKRILDVPEVERLEL